MAECVACAQCVDAHPIDEPTDCNCSCGHTQHFIARWTQVDSGRAVIGGATFISLDVLRAHIPVPQHGWASNISTVICACGNSCLDGWLMHIREITRG